MLKNFRAAPREKWSKSDRSTRLEIIVLAIRIDNRVKLWIEVSISCSENLCSSSRNFLKKVELWRCSWGDSPRMIRMFRFSVSKVQITGNRKISQAIDASRCRSTSGRRLLFASFWVPESREHQNLQSATSRLGTLAMCGIFALETRLFSRSELISKPNCEPNLPFSDFLFWLR